MTDLVLRPLLDEPPSGRAFWPDWKGDIIAELQGADKEPLPPYKTLTIALRRLSGDVIGVLSPADVDRCVFHSNFP